MANNNVNVSFKKGTEERLWSQNTQIINGTFYLTTDTHRLYIGQEVDENGTTELFPVNEGVITVQKIENLPSSGTRIAGQFYYASDENVLCVWNGSQWVQINPDTNTYVNQATLNFDNNNGVSLTLRQNNGNEVPTTKKIKFTGNLEVSKDGNDDIVVNADIPDLNVTWTANNASNGTREHVDIGLGEKTLSLTGGSDIVLTETHDANGNNVTISAVDKSPQSLNIVPQGGNSTGFQVSIPYGTAGDAVSATLNPRVKYDTDSYAYFSKANSSDANGTLDLTSAYYTKTQVDNLITAFDAVEYKGVWPTGANDSYTEFPSTGVQNGSMYMIVAEGTGDNVKINGKTPKVGDLIIAQNAEGVNPQVEWALIPSGDEAVTDTTYSFIGVTDNTKGEGVDARPSTGSDVLPVFRVKAGNSDVVISRESDNKTNFTIAHKEYSTPTSSTAAYDGSAAASGFDVVSGITVSNGHVTGINKQHLAAPVELKELKSSVAAANNIATYTATAKQKILGESGTDDYGSTFSVNLKIKGEDGMSVSTVASDGGETADAISIGMVWGSF